MAPGRQGRFISRKKEAVETILSKQMRPALDALADESARKMAEVVPVDEGDLKQSVGWSRGKKNPLARYVTAKFYWRFLNDGTIHLPALQFVDSVKRFSVDRLADAIRRFPL